MNIVDIDVILFKNSKNVLQKAFTSRNLYVFQQQAGTVA